MEPDFKSASTGVNIALSTSPRYSCLAATLEPSMWEELCSTIPRNGTEYQFYSASI
ncbi:hypothetical protein ARMGADRAFT_1012228 [Armillaria gallica]|uniref:Uncharacterized protein n=1 Tax=Armillaria gallica TaxID=47427 RepID=A0A2H3DFU7_ARMGA|nr:hypothetical protein ARMGADRAFT_1012228 [Armillaria gallica]